jgi:Fe-S oxidoreductase
MMKEEMKQGEETEKIEDYLINELMPCEKCHFCNTVCPIVGTRVTQGPFGINRAIYYGIRRNQFDRELRDLVYSCTTCGKCDDMCKRVSRALPLVDIFEKAREFLFVEKMVGPMPDQRDVVKNIFRKGNPWGYAPQERTKWAEGLDIKFASKDNKVDVLYYVGCTTSYDPQGQRIAMSLSKILKRAGVHFGILEKEQSSGSEAKRMGETGLFEHLAEGNVKMFKEAKIDHIVTGDPHAYYSFSHEYPKEGNELKVEHSTQFLNRLLDEGRLKLSSKMEKRVTYHDPCYLGRKSAVFEEPRKLIKRIPGVTLAEMEMFRQNSDCCGMGGGRMWMEIPKGLVSSQAIAEKRVKQALETGAEVLFTACPFCKITLTDAVKAMNVERAIEVMDITELVAQTMIGA